MAPSTPRLRILSVGGNAVSAFLSWRLSATNACDVTLVWKSGYGAVSQYGISFKSTKFGNERFKPRHVVKTPEEAAGHSRASFDYVLLCVKALPDVYDLASVIESVVSPQHTCILVNTTHTLGIESYLEQRFPTNVVLSLVSGAEVTQLGASEFEHKGSTELWVGAANRNPNIPASIQTDMAEALSMTLKSGQVDCEVSPNIRQQQYERNIGPIAFHPASIVFETPSHAELLEKVGVRSLVIGTIDELLVLAKTQGCVFPPGFKEKTMEQMIAPSETNSIMYQDFTARRPMEIETFLGSPIKLAQEVGLQVPRIETLYALLHNANTMNQTRPHQDVPTSPVLSHPPRMSSAPPPKQPYGPGPGPFRGPPMQNGMPPRSRVPSAAGGPLSSPMRRAPPSMNGFPPPRMPNGNGYGPRGPGMQRRPSLEGNDLEEFSHLMLYDNIPEGELAENVAPYGDGAITPSSSSDMALRQRELRLREKELHIREREWNMRQRGGGRRGPPPPPPQSHHGYDDDDEDGEDFFDPMAGPGHSVPQIDAENFDMMSVTSRRTRKAPSASQLRVNTDFRGLPPQARQGRGPWGKPSMKNRTSARLTQDLPGLRDDLMNNSLTGYTSDRYGNVDRQALSESRTNSLTAEKLSELQRGGSYVQQGGYPPVGPPMGRRASQSPGNPLSPGARLPKRPLPPNGTYQQQPNGMIQNGNGRPSPPGMLQPVPRHPPGHRNAVAPQQVEQQVGVSSLYPPKSGPQVRSLTGSASASAGSGDSHGSVPIDSEPSAHSSSSSLGPRAPISVQ